MQTFTYSKFNLIVQEAADKVLLYNTYTLRWRRFPRQEFESIFNKTNMLTEELSEYSITEGFMVPAELDEIQRLKDDVNSFWEQKDYIDLTLFVTMACNYRCVYCFEKEHLCNTEHMSKETADDILDFIKRRYAEHQFNNKLHIKWFGGEPLLNMPIIRYISSELKNKNIEFIARMYTNGRLLTKETALELKELGVTGPVVIPIDGLAPTYAKLKNCAENDFHAVIENIKNAEDILNICIHINVSEVSKDDAEKLYDYLREEIGLKCRITYERVAPMNGAKVDNTNSISSKYLYKLKDSIDKSRTINKIHGCEARNPNYIAIGCNGALYLCDNLVGRTEYSVGNIKDKNIRLDRNGTIFDINVATSNCQKCKILPLCIGKCTKMIFIDKIDCNKDLYIENIKSRLLKIISSRNYKK